MKITIKYETDGLYFVAKTELPARSTISAVSPNGYEDAKDRLICKIRLANGQLPIPQPEEIEI